MVMFYCGNMGYFFDDVRPECYLGAEDCSLNNSAPIKSHTKEVHISLEVKCEYNQACYFCFYRC